MFPLHPSQCMPNYHIPIVKHVKVHGYNEETKTG